MEFDRGDLATQSHSVEGRRDAARCAAVNDGVLGGGWVPKNSEDAIRRKRGLGKVVLFVVSTYPTVSQHHPNVQA
jgi:hypothetical protein